MGMLQISGLKIEQWISLRCVVGMIKKIILFRQQLNTRKKVQDPL